MISKENNSVNVKGSSNNIYQIDNVYEIKSVSNKSEYQPDEYAIRLLKETIEDEDNPTIMLVQVIGNRTIQCGSGRFSVSSSSQGERKMTYWEDALKKLEKNDYIYGIGHKGEIFKINKKGYEYYDEYIKNKK